MIFVSGGRRATQPPPRMLSLFALLLSAPPNARRLISQQPIGRRVPVSAAAAGYRISSAKQQQRPPPPSPPAALESASAVATWSNRTAELLATRRLLLQRVAEIDAQLAKERDSRRAELTARYELALQALDNEERASTLTGGAPMAHDVRATIADAIYRAPHQDVAHQDIDIDVVLNHIDTDGDGVLTRAEVRGASVGAAIWQAIGVVPTYIVGCFAGVACYLVCRWLSARWQRAAKPAGYDQSAHALRHGLRTSPAASAAAGEPGAAVRNRKKQGGQPPPPVPTTCVPSIAC